MHGTKTIERIAKPPRRSEQDDRFALGQVRNGLKRAVKDERSKQRDYKREGALA